MAQYYDYERGGRRRRNQPREEGFFDRVRDWFRERVDDGNRSQGEPEGRDYRGDWRRDPYRSRLNRDTERDYQNRRGFNPDNAEWERTRLWRRDRAEYSDPRQGYGHGEYRQQDYFQDEGQRYEQNRERDYGRSDYDQDYNRGYGGRYDPGYSRDYGRDYGSYYHHNYNRDYDSDFDRGSDRDYRTRGGAYPSAGMRADYNGDFDYSDRYEEDQVNYGEGDIGYEREGAFYQDLDEPENLRSQAYRYRTGRSPYLGIGPQGYRRSDERISDDIHERLTRHGRVDARQIHVDVKDGEVTLKGKVPYREMKRLAEDVAENVSGVTDVHNEIRVEQPVRQRWENREGETYEERSQFNTQTSAQNRQQNWETRSQRATESAVEGLEASGETESRAASLDELGAAATTQPVRSQHNVRTDMEVIGTDGKLVGRVKEVRQNDFLIDREMARDIYVPFSAISGVGQSVLLNVTADDVDMQGWEKPELF